MQTLIRTKGWITHASILQPRSGYGAEEVFRLSLSPEFPWIYNEIEDMATELKDEKKQSSPTQYSFISSSEPYPDHLINGSEILFETIRKPQLLNTLAKFENDDEFLGEFVQVVGHMQIHDLGIVYISPHIIETAYKF